MPVKNPDLISLFEEAKKMLEPYEKHLHARRDEPGHYDLWSERDVIVNGKKRDSVYFASLIIQKSYVGFYFMPVYTHEEAKDMFGAELMSLLKGKSCFYLRELTPELKRQMKDALKQGYALYKERDWV